MRQFCVNKIVKRHSLYLVYQLLLDNTKLLSRLLLILLEIYLRKICKIKKIIK